MGTCASCTNVSFAVHNHQHTLAVQTPAANVMNNEASQVSGGRSAAAAATQAIAGQDQNLPNVKTTTLAALTTGAVTTNSKSRRDGSGKPAVDNDSDNDSIKTSETLNSQVTNLASISLDKAESTRYAREEVGCERMPEPGTPEATYVCAVRLRKLVTLVHTDSLSTDILIENLTYTIKVLNAVYIDETKRLCNEDDDLPHNSTDVPHEVRDWLASTFTRSMSAMRQNRLRPNFRSVATAIRAGIMVERRIFRRMSSSGNLDIPPNVMILMKTGIDQWNFSIFDLNEASNNHCMKFVGFELIHRYDFLTKFKITPSALENFLGHLEAGYSKNNNPYHNLIHGVDVAQTCHMIMNETRLLDWLSDLEVFAVLFAALIHDYEHTGTTNNFHINTSSDLALLYNDRGVLENHHISASFRLMREQEDCGILNNMKKEEYREFRNYVIEMVINTDMSLHFQQLKNMKNLLSMPENIDKGKALSLMLHCADIGHPSKCWELHEKWTNMVSEEFFRQGDREQELGLPYSPLCDRSNTVVAQSQIGFIDFIVSPSFQVLGSMLDTIMSPILNPPPPTDPTESKEGNNPPNLTRQISTPRAVSKPWEYFLTSNKEEWKKKAAELTKVEN